MLRSTAAGTYRVHHALNSRRAITLCWTAKIPRRVMSIATLGISGPGVPESMVLGRAIQFATKPMEYTMAPRNMT